MMTNITIKTRITKIPLKTFVELYQQVQNICSFQVFKKQTRSRQFSNIVGCKINIKIIIFLYMINKQSF